MKTRLLALLLATCALPSCQTAHNAAVSTFRVIDAPHQYIRRELGVDNDQQDTTTTSTTTTTETNAPPNGNGYPQPYQQRPPRQLPPPTVAVNPPPPPAPPRRTVVTEQTREFQPEVAPTATPRLSRTTGTSSDARTAASKSSPPPHSVGADKTSLPYAKPVPGKPGYVFSPFDPNGGYVDVTGFAPGSKVKDPYSGKVFLVP